MKQIDKLRILVFATLLLLAAGCTSETEELTSGTPVEVDFALPGIGSPAPASRATLAAKTTARIIPYNVTRARYETAATYYVDASGKLAPCTVNADGSFAAVSSTKMKLMMSDNYTFYTAIPALPIKSGTDYTMTVSNGMDFASSLTSNITVTPANAASLPLNQLSRYAAQINVVVKSTDALVKSLKAVAPGMELSNLPPNMDRTLDGTETTGSDGTQTLASAVGNATQTDVRTITYAPVCILPKAGTTPLLVSPTVAITVGTTTKIVTYTASLPTAGNGSQFEAGKSYTVTLIVTPDDLAVVPTVEITEWVTGGDIATYPYVKANEAGKMSVIVSRDLFGASTATFHEPWFQTPDHRGNKDATDGGFGCYVAPMFEVEATNRPTDVNWVSTNGTCKAPWRRPTLKEVMLMASLQNQLSDVAPFTGRYWTATPANWYGTGAMNVDFLTNTVYDNDFNTGATVYDRCVRDVFTGNTYPYVVNGYFIVSKDEGGSSGAALHENWPSGTPPHNRDSPDNSISARFEISQADAAQSNWDSTNGPCDVTNGWRRPTLAEMQLLVKMKLEGRLSLTNITGYHYNTATQNGTCSEDNNGNYWAQCDYSHTNAFNSGKWVFNRGNRCIRDF